MACPFSSMNQLSGKPLTSKLLETSLSVSEVTLMDMNFEKIVENDDLFSHITSENSSDLDEIREQLEKIGVKVDDQEKIEISFR